jgi:hypothetical protein
MYLEFVKSSPPEQLDDLGEDGLEKLEFVVAKTEN